MSKTVTVSKKYWNPEKYTPYIESNSDETTRNGVLMLLKDLKKIVRRFLETFTSEEITYGEIMKLNRVYNKTILGEFGSIRNKLVYKKNISGYSVYRYVWTESRVVDNEYTRSVEEAIREVLENIDITHLSNSEKVVNRLKESLEIIKETKSNVLKRSANLEVHTDVEGRFSKKSGGEVKKQKPKTEPETREKEPSEYIDRHQLEKFLIKK
jgi:6-pyruvoyl-tetrahydropterin synthase